MSATPQRTTVVREPRMSSVAHGEPVNLGARPAAELAERTQFLLHPCFLVRIAGSPSGAIDHLVHGDTARLLRRSQEFADRAALQKADVCADIEQSIKKMTERSDIRRALGVRRDIYNLRGVDPVHASTLRRYLSDEQMERLTAVATRLAERDALLGKKSDAYRNDVAAESGALERLFAGPDIRAALQLLKPRLFRRLRALFEHAEEKYSEKERRSLETSFLAYLLRGTVKTNPLGRITVVAVGAWADEGSGRLDLDYGEWRLRSDITVRRTLVHKLMEPFSTARGGATAGAALRLNSTVRSEGDQLVWESIGDASAKNSRVYGNVAMQVRARRSGLLELVTKHFCDRDTPIERGEFERWLCARLPPPKWAGAREFVGDLLERQFLVADDGYFDQCDIIEWAMNRLESETEERCVSLHGGLAELRAALARCAAGEPTDRAEGIECATRAVADCIVAAGLPPEWAFDEDDPVLVEDVMVDAEPRAVRPEALSERTDLEMLLELMPLFDFNTRIQSWVGHRFVERFGREGSCEPWAPFLEEMKGDLNAIYRRASSAAGERSHEAIGSSLLSESAPAATLETLAAEFFDGLESHCDAEDFTLDPQWVRDLIRRIPAEVAARPTSQCFIGQFARDPDTGRRAFVLNRVYQGHSKILSRFVPERGGRAAAAREYLAKLSRGRLHAEIPGVFGFNGSLHPPLAPVELSIPPFPGGFESLVALDPRSLTMYFEAREGRVALQTRGGTRVEPFYLGLLAPFLLPPVHYMLDVLFSQATHSGSLMVMFARRRLRSKRVVTRMPRIRLGSIVLMRRGLLIPRPYLPALGKDEEAFFFSVQEWRRDLELPTEAFISSPADVWQPQMSEPRSPGEPLKPMYMNFDSPLLVRLFRKALRKVQHGLIVSELLPSRLEPTVRVRGDVHVCEFSIEMAGVPGGSF